MKNIRFSASDNSCDTERPQNIRIVHTQWSGGRLIAQLLQDRLSDQCYHVTKRSTSILTGVKLVSKDAADIFVGGWIPLQNILFTDLSLLTGVNQIGSVYSPARVGLMVRNDHPLTSISELRNSDVQRIYSLASSSGVGAQISEVSSSILNNNQQLVVRNTEQLLDLIEDGEVVSGWTPHPVFGNGDYRFLEVDIDGPGINSLERGNYFPFLVRRHLLDPCILSILDNFQLSEDALEEGDE